MGAGCTHKGLVQVLTIKECRLWAGAQREAKPRLGRMSLVISLLGETGRPKLGFKMSRGASRTLAALTNYARRRSACIALDWPDMSVPEVDGEFWSALVEDLSKVQGDAVVFCMGGHGRTGTTLAILSAMTGACGSEDPVEWVRRVYCQDAVETASQIAYLRDMGITTTAEGSHGRGKWSDDYFGRDGHQEYDSLWPERKHFLKKKGNGGNDETRTR